jgi:hypothetical protein
MRSFIFFVDVSTESGGVLDTLAEWTVNNVDVGAFPVTMLVSAMDA